MIRRAKLKAGDRPFGDRAPPVPADPLKPGHEWVLAYRPEVRLSLLTGGHVAEVWWEQRPVELVARS